MIHTKQICINHDIEVLDIEFVKYLSNFTDGIKGLIIIGSRFIDNKITINADKQYINDFFMVIFLKMRNTKNIRKIMQEAWMVDANIVPAIYISQLVLSVNKYFKKNITILVPRKNLNWTHWISAGNIKNEAQKKFSLQSKYVINLCKR